MNELTPLRARMELVGSDDELPPEDEVFELIACFGENTALEIAIDEFRKVTAAGDQNAARHWRAVVNGIKRQMEFAGPAIQ
jgi:hypothetical protein